MIKFIVVALQIAALFSVIWGLNSIYRSKPSNNMFISITRAVIGCAAATINIILAFNIWKRAGLPDKYWCQYYADRLLKWILQFIFK